MIHHKIDLRAPRKLNLKRYRVYVVLCVFMVLSTMAKAQQDPMFTQYMFNTMAINPAYAGSRDALTATMLSRHQWVGFAGAPSSQTLNVHSPFIRPELGAGLSVMMDKAGPVQNTSLYTDLAYRMRLSEKGRLALGIKGGFNLMQGDIASLIVIDKTDPATQRNIEGVLLPNFGFGMYYYQERFYAGVSSPKLLENDFYSDAVTGATSIAGERRHYYFIAGAVFNLSDDIKFKPSLLTKVVSNAPVQLDFTANFLLKEKVWLGAMFRSGDAAGLLMQFNINEQLRLGYAFDFPFTPINRYSGGTHEVMLSYDFIFNRGKRIMSPRYF